MEQDMTGGMSMGWLDMTTMTVLLIAIVIALAVATWALIRTGRADRAALAAARRDSGIESG